MRERPVGETLDRAPPTDDATRAELVGPDRAAGRERGELAQVDDRVRNAADRPEAALREPALERHLAALVAGRAVATRARQTALVSSPGRLALARAGTASDPLARPGRAGGGMEAAQVHLSPPPRRGARRPAACRGWAPSP